MGYFTIIFGHALLCIYLLPMPCAPYPLPSVSKAKLCFPCASLTHNGSIKQEHWSKVIASAQKFIYYPVVNEFLIGYITITFGHVSVCICLLPLCPLPSVPKAKLCFPCASSTHNGSIKQKRLKPQSPQATVCCKVGAATLVHLRPVLGGCTILPFKQSHGVFYRHIRTCFTVQQLLYLLPLCPLPLTLCPHGWIMFPLCSLNSNGNWPPLLETPVYP